jgi:hypothetical protein
MLDVVTCVNAVELDEQPGEFLVVVKNDIAAASDYREALTGAGYVRQFSNLVPDGEGLGGEFVIHSSSRDDRPAYFIEVNGAQHSLAYLVADDFPQLVATLEKLGALIELMGIEQRAVIRIQEKAEEQS